MSRPNAANTPPRVPLGISQATSRRPAHRIRRILHIDEPCMAPLCNLVHCLEVRIVQCGHLQVTVDP